MPKRLLVNLLPGWADYSHENPDGPPTYLRDASASPGPLQVSCAWYTSGAAPAPDYGDLVELAAEVGNSFESARLLKTISGSCVIGRSGSAVFHCKQFPHVRAWYLSNGKDLVTVTHVCGPDPDPAELREAELIVESLAIAGSDDAPQRSGAARVFSGIRKWLGE